MTAVRRARLLVAYDGAAFHGFAKNRDVATVAGTLEAALSTVTRIPVELVGAGRTDAGVHAWGRHRPRRSGPAAQQDVRAGAGRP
jgi:tRNA pseudouridine38-40 synthase